LSKYFIDVFNGDADGLCALVQLRRHKPLLSKLVTGVKRDINLLASVSANKGDHVTVLDISFEKNVDDVKRLVNSGVSIEYIDHHKVGKSVSHALLEADIDLSSDMCTSLIVNRRLQGKYCEWAITGAFGDNLTKVAWQMGKELGISDDSLELMKNLGIYLNYNGYGANLDDLFFNPAELYKKISVYDSPLEFIQADSTTFSTLENGYKHDLEMANSLPEILSSENVSMIELPDEKWARRVSGVFGNDLANRYPQKAHAILIKKSSNDYLISIRAPLNKKEGADVVASQFPTGGGRKGAAGINALPEDMLEDFIQAMLDQYS